MTIVMIRTVSKLIVNSDKAPTNFFISLTKNKLTMSNKDSGLGGMRDLLKKLRPTSDHPGAEIHKLASHSSEMLDSPSRIRPKRPHESRFSRTDSSTNDTKLYYGRGFLSPPKPDSRSRDSSRRRYHQSKRDSSRPRDSSRKSDYQSTTDSSRRGHQSKQDSSRSKDSSHISDYDSSAESHKPRDSSHRRDSSRSRISSRRSHSRSRTDSSRSRVTSDRSKSRSRPDSSAPKNKSSSSKKHSYASLRTCTDEKSSAEDCFDYFMLTCYFPKAAALAAQKLGQDYHKDKLIDDWVIHGLWASSAKYGKELEKQCSDLINLWFDENLLLDSEDLEKQLREKWFSVYDKPGYTDEGFWKHEFHAHGKCATRSEHVKDQKGYFKLSLELFNKAELKKTLADGGFVKGASVTWSKMYKIITKKHGAYPKIEQVWNPDKEIFHPQEIKLFYDHDLKPMDCPGEPHLDPNFQCLKFYYDIKLRKIQSSKRRHSPSNSGD